MVKWMPRLIETLEQTLIGAVDYPAFKELHARCW
jgi:hypothetical protein